MAAALVARAGSHVHGWWGHAVLLLAFAIVAFPVVAHQAVTNTELSVFDEWQYSDRVHQVARGDLFMPHGEAISDWGQSTRACRGIVRVAEPVPAPCVGGTIGETPNSAASDPPPYYWATGAVTGALLVTGIVDSALTAGRLAGALWAALSMWSLFLLSRALGAGRGASLVVASTILLVPALQQQYTFITPHALDVPVGAFATLATLRFMRREWPWWTLVLAGSGVAGVKGSNIVIVVGLGIALLAVACWPGTYDRSVRVRALVAGTVLSASTIVLTVVWMVVLRLTRVADPDPPGNYAVDSLDPLQLAYDSVRFLAPYGENALGVPATWFTMAMTGSALALWAGLAREEKPFVRQLAPGYLLGAALGPLVLDLMVFVTTGQYIGIHTRYGLALWPLGLGFLALLLRTRTSLVIAGLALLLYAAAPAIAGLDSVAM